MAKVTVKEIKDDALIPIEMNKSFYFMLKNTLFYLFKNSPNSEEQEKALAGLMEKDYASMSHWEQSFYTLTLLLAEVEKQAVERNLFVDVEVDLPEESNQG